MVTSEELQRELDDIRREIDELREYESEIEIALSAVSGRLKWLRAPYAYLLKKSVRDRIDSLKLRHNIVNNCYFTVRRCEERESMEVRYGRDPEGRVADATRHGRLRQPRT